MLYKALFYILLAIVLFYVGFPMILIGLNGAIMAIDPEDYASGYERLLSFLIGFGTWLYALFCIWKASKHLSCRSN